MLNTIFILRSRWQEVLLIVGLQAASAFAFMQAMQARAANNAGSSDILPFAVLLFVTFSVIAKMLSIGFARTSFTDGPMHYEPWSLLKIGYHFFWRIIGFEIVVGLIAVSIIVGLYMLSALVGLESAKEKLQQPDLVALYCAVIGILLVSKLVLFGPAAIMVTDCTVFGAFGWMTWLKIFRELKLLLIYVLWLSVVIAPNFISESGGREFIETYAAMIIFSVLAGLLTLFIYVMAVKAVSDVYLPSQLSENGFGTETQPEPPQQ